MTRSRLAALVVLLVVTTAGTALATTRVLRDGADIAIQVDEPISASDSAGALPPTQAAADEGVSVSDTASIVGPIALTDDESIVATDSAGAIPPTGVAADESVQVGDTATVLGPLLVTDDESIGVTDGPGLALSPSIAVSEAVGVTDSVSVQIQNTPPVARAGGPYTVAEGSTITLAGSASDADGDTLTAAWDLDGDGTFETSGLTPTFHGVEGPASIPVRLRVCDGRGACSFDSATVTVTNVAPAVTITGPATRSGYLVGTAVTFTGSFSDPGVLDTHTAQWSFDALTTPGTVSESNGSGSVLASYTFTKAGVYSVALRVADDDGGIGAAATIGGAEALVAVYDPAAGFVTGSGSFSGPTGTATFALSARYTRSGLAGSFSLVAPAVSFGSTGLEWLVVSGQRAELFGTGTLNGAAGYRFLVIAEDGPVDKIRVEIWGSSPVYDNAPGSSEDLDLAVLRPVAGQIVIHR